jgi:Ankyrin repeats (many copies)
MRQAWAISHACGNGSTNPVRLWTIFAATTIPTTTRARSHLGWDHPTAQQVLDVALAFAVTNDHFDVADFLLAHGADINTRWGSHEPASLLHHLTSNGTYESMQFVIDRGIDMTIKDYRWNGTAQGWAYYANKDRNMARWLATERQRRSNKRAGRSPPQ